MPIEFLCNGCQQHLRVPDDSAGKKAKCPNCSAIVDVPSNQTNMPEPDWGTAGGTAGNVPNPSGLDETVASPSPHNNAANPYAAPSAIPSYNPSPTGALSVQPIDPGYALSSAWNLFQQHALILIGAYVILTALNIGLSFLGGLVQGIVGEIQGNPNSLLVILLGLGFSVGNSLIQAWLTIGAIRIYLAAARNQPVEISMLFSGADQLLSYFVVSIMFGLAVGIGFVLLIIPGIYVLLTYWPCIYFLIDRRVGILESFQLAAVHSSGNRLNTLLLGLISIGLGLLGLLTCGLGFLIVGPLLFMMFTVAYLMMTGQYFAQPTQP